MEDLGVNSGKVKKEYTREQVGAMCRAISIGKRLAQEHPEIANLYRSIENYGSKSEDIWSCAKIAEKYLPLEASTSLKVASSAVSLALEELIDKEERKELARLHQQAGGYYIMREYGIANFHLSPKERSRISRKAGIKTTRRRGMVPWYRREREQAYQLSLNPEYQHRRGRANHKKIANEINRVYHQGKNVRNTRAISLALVKMRKIKRQKSEEEMEIKIERVDGLEEILGDLEISDFSKSWIKNTKPSKDSIRQVYEFLRKYGIDKEKIALHAALLAFNPERIERNYQALRKLGLSDKQIAGGAELLGRDPKTIERNYQALRKLGLSNRKIATCTYLLGASPERIERNYQALRKLGLSDKQIAKAGQVLANNPESIRGVYQMLRSLGLSDKKIAIRASLLTMNPKTIESKYQIFKKLGVNDRRIASCVSLLQKNLEKIEERYQELKKMGLDSKDVVKNPSLLGVPIKTIERKYQLLKRLGFSDRRIARRANLLLLSSKTIKTNYQHAIGLLRQEYGDRNSGKELLLSQPQLMGISPETIKANIQYLSSISIDYNNGPILGTKTQTKRRKLAWMLRELFDYRKVAQEKKKEIIHKLYDFVRKNPAILVSSINTLEATLDSLRYKVQNYSQNPGSR